MIDDDKFREMLKVQQFLKAYDSSIAGAVGEMYAELVLGMKKAERGTKCFDGWIAGQKISVKTKENDDRQRSGRSSQVYAEISAKCIDKAQMLLLVILCSDGSVKHYGPVAFDLLEMPKPASKTAALRFSLTTIEKACLANALPCGETGWKGGA